MSKEVGRNQPCPCGSGKKYKHCCWGTDAQSKSKNRNLLVFGGALLVGLIVVFVIMSDEESPSDFQSTQPGQTPAGKVWSDEHGHWHDAPGTAALSLPSVLPLGDSTLLTPQPPDSAPPGKVWSPDHGHWHDAPPGDSF